MVNVEDMRVVEEDDDLVEMKLGAGLKTKKEKEVELEIEKKIKLCPVAVCLIKGSILGLIAALFMSLISLIMILPADQDIQAGSNFVMIFIAWVLVFFGIVRISNSIVIRVNLNEDKKLYGITFSVSLLVMLLVLGLSFLWVFEDSILI